MRRGGGNRDAGDARGDESYRYDANGNRTYSHQHGGGYVTELGNRLISDGIYYYAYDEEGNELTPPVPRDGYHVNCKWNGAVPLTFSTRAIYPVTPHRIFYGDDLTAIAAAAAAAAGASAGY